MGSNELICEQIRKILYKKQDIIKAICSQSEGYISIFIRNGSVQKLIYQRDVVVADRSTVETALDYIDSVENSEEYFKPQQVIPEHVYRRFAYLIATSTLTIAPMDYGHLRYHFTFEKNDDNWREAFKMTFDKEHHFTAADFQ